MIRMTVALATTGLLCACATTDPGWTGSQAVPFGQAEADCKTSVSTIAEAETQEQTFADCMATKGWTRT